MYPPIYSEVIKHGETALGYKTAKQFSDGLLALLDEASLRKKIGSNAMTWTKKNRDSKKCVKMWVTAYGSI